MSERQLFAVYVRVTGMVMALYGLNQWLLVVARLVNPTGDSSSVPPYFPIYEEIVFGVFWIGLGLFLLTRSSWLVRLACRSDSN